MRFLVFWIKFEWQKIQLLLTINKSMHTLTITDETAVGNLLNELRLQFDSEYITVKELIATRVKEEVILYKKRVGDYRTGLVLPADLEKRLNKKKVITIDEEKQI